MVQFESKTHPLISIICFSRFNPEYKVHPYDKYMSYYLFETETCQSITTRHTEGQLYMWKLWIWTSEDPAYSTINCVCQSASHVANVDCIL